MAAPLSKPRLDSWKEIADYLDRDVSTVMRWARERGLPVHRLPGGKRQGVFAFAEEIDAWMLSTGVRDSGLGVGEKGSDPRGPERGVGLPTPSMAGEETGHREQVPVAREGVVAAGGRGSDASAARLRFPDFRTLFRYGAGFVAVAALVGLTYILARPLPEPHLLGSTPVTNDGRNKIGSLVTDGARIYFIEELPGGRAVVQVPVSGGEVQPLSTFFKNPGMRDLSLSRAEFLVADPIETPGIHPALWALPLSGGQPRRLGNIEADAAAWSPDGNSIAYSFGPDLYICRSDGTASRKIISLGGHTSFIRWSPDGWRLRFSLDKSGSRMTRIWEVHPDGSGLRPVLGAWRSTEGSDDGMWTRDGKYFLILHGHECADDLWALPERAGILGLHPGQAVQLTSGPFRVETVVPSMDDRKLFVLAGHRRRELLRFDQSSHGFVPYLAGVSAGEVDFSRDGKWITYTDDAEGNLWRRGAEGSQPLQLTFPPLRAELPRWSPDGQQIAFMGRKGPDDVWQVLLMPAHGGESHPVLPAPYPQGAPTWSPDGTQLVFGELTGNSTRDPAGLAIHVVNLRTQKATTLPGSTGLWTARWSPDGQHIAALTADSRTLMAFDLRSRRWKKITVAGNITDLSWSRDSDEIYFEDFLPPYGPSLFHVRLRDGQVDKVASLQGEPPILSPWFGLTPEDSPLVSNAAAQGEIYALDWQEP